MLLAGEDHRPFLISTKNSQVLFYVLRVPFSVRIFHGVGWGGRTDSALCEGVQAADMQPFGDLSSPCVEPTLKSLSLKVRNS